MSLKENMAELSFNEKEARVKETELAHNEN